MASRTSSFIMLHGVLFLIFNGEWCWSSCSKVKNFLWKLPKFNTNHGCRSINIQGAVGTTWRAWRMFVTLSRAPSCFQRLCWCLCNVIITHQKVFVFSSLHTPFFPLFFYNPNATQPIISLDTVNANQLRKLHAGFVRRVSSVVEFVCYVQL